MFKMEEKLPIYEVRNISIGAMYTSSSVRAFTTVALFSFLSRVYVKSKVLTQHNTWNVEAIIHEL